MDAARAHRVGLEVVPVPAQNTPVGAEVSFRIRASCPSGCDLRGSTVRIVAGDELLASGEIVDYQDGVGETERITLTAPSRVGDHAWTVRFSAQEVGAALHGESSEDVHVTTAPHSASLAVWDAPSPLEIGSLFSIEIGGKCALGCDLSGERVEVRDAAGRTVGNGRLGPTGAAGETARLHRARIHVVAPSDEGMVRWLVLLEASGQELAHAPASAAFSFAVVRPPEHRLTIEVVESETDAPIEDAQVRLGVFRASTDESGVAVVEMPRGRHELAVWKAGYEAPSTTLDLEGDLTVQIRASVIPDRSEWEDD